MTTITVSSSQQCQTAECIELVGQTWCLGQQIVPIQLLPFGETFTLVSAPPSGVTLQNGTTIQGTPSVVGQGVFSYRVDGSSKTCSISYDVRDCSVSTAPSGTVHYIA